MTMTEWAEREIKIACEREKEAATKDGNLEDATYGVMCYESALKAYNSLMDDGHSGMSFSITRSILQRLCEDLPLTPIKDEDFFTEPVPDYAKDTDRLKEMGLKSDIQCPRMFSLFRIETLDGKVMYHDLNRISSLNVENNAKHSCASNSYIGKLINEMYPIKMPYYPKINEKFEVHFQDYTFKENGDTRFIIGVRLPDNSFKQLNKYLKVENGDYVEITKEEFDKRIDNIEEK